MKKYSNLILLGLFLGIIVWNFLRIDAVSHSVSDTLRPVILETMALALVFYLLHRYIINKK